MTLTTGDRTAHEIAAAVWVLSEAKDRSTATGHHPDDLTRCREMPAWRAEEFLAGRAALRRLLHQVCPSLAGSPVRPAPDGRPVLAARPDFGISVSHDAGTVAVAAAPGRLVGVDVQEPSPEVSDALLRRCLHAHAGHVGRRPPAERARELAWVWTAQEACVKAAGTGISGRPWAIDVPPGRRRGRWGPYRWISLRDRSDTPLSCAFTDLRPAHRPLEEEEE